MTFKPFHQNLETVIRPLRHPHKNGISHGSNHYLSFPTMITAPSSECVVTAQYLMSVPATITEADIIPVKRTTHFIENDTPMIRKKRKTLNHP